MPRRAIFDPKKAGEAARKKDMTTTRRERMDAGIQAATLLQYRQKAIRLEKFREALGKQDVPWTTDMFLLAVEGIADSGLKEAESWRSALLHHLMGKGEDYAFLQSTAVKKATGGIRLQARLKTKSQGSISAEMFADLIAWLRKRNQVRTALFATIIFGAQLRVAEARDLRIGDTQQDGKGGMILIRKDKRFNRKRAYKKGQVKNISIKLMDLIKRMERALPLGEQRIFPDGKSLSTDLRKAIKRAAKDLGWPTDVEFRGPHALRHGGTCLVLARARQTLEEGFANQSKQTVRHYGKKNVER